MATYGLATFRDTIGRLYELNVDFNISQTDMLSVDQVYCRLLEIAAGSRDVINLCSGLATAAEYSQAITRSSSYQDQACRRIQPDLIVLPPVLVARMHSWRRCTSVLP